MEDTNQIDIEEIQYVCGYCHRLLDTRKELIVHTGEHLK